MSLRIGNLNTGVSHPLAQQSFPLYFFPLLDYPLMEALLDQTVTLYSEVSLSYDFHVDNRRQDTYGCYQCNNWAGGKRLHIYLPNPSVDSLQVTDCESELH